MARTPISRAASKSSLAPRTDKPNRVRRKTNAVMARTTAVTTIVTMSITSNRTSPISTVLNTHPGLANDFFVGETNTAHNAWESRSRANEVRSSVNGLALRTHRKAISSDATAASTAASTMAGAISHQSTSLVDRK